MPSRRMNNAARSFTEPPGLSHSALRNKGGRGRWRAVEGGSGISGVLPTSAHNAGSRPVSTAFHRPSPPFTAVVILLPSQSPRRLRHAGRGDDLAHELGARPHIHERRLASLERLLHVRTLGP